MLAYAISGGRQLILVTCVGTLMQVTAEYICTWQHSFTFQIDKSVSTIFDKYNYYSSHGLKRMNNYETQIWKKNWNLLACYRKFPQCFPISFLLNNETEEFQCLRQPVECFVQPPQLPFFSGDDEPGRCCMDTSSCRSLLKKRILRPLLGIQC